MKFNSILLGGLLLATAFSVSARDVPAQASDVQIKQAVIE